MNKYYRVIKENFLWEVGAILEFSNKYISGDGGYLPIEDIWNKTEDQADWITTSVIEDSPEYFERVYRDNITGKVFKTAEQLKQTYSKAFAK